MDIAGVWDIECGDWTRFRVGQLLALDGYRYTSRWDDPDDFFDALMRRGGIWYAHVGGRYDILWALDIAVRRKIPWSAVLRGSSVLSARIGDTELRDSFAIVPMALARAATLGGKAKLDLSLPCECGKDCGGYCALSRPLSRNERRKVEYYLSADCDATLAMLSALAARAEHDGISLRQTIGGSAWATARDWGGLPGATHSLGRYRAIRRALFGGRCQVYQSRAGRGHRHDIHSSYVATLARLRLPVGEPAPCDAAAAARRFARGDDGVFAATVTMPAQHIPPLPARVTSRLIYPCGRFEGVWTGIELRYAQSCGARIERFRGAYAWAESEPVMSGFARRVWRYRDSAENEGWKEWYKTLGNSATGKLGQKPEHEALSFVPSVDGYPPEIDDSTERIIAVSSNGAYVGKPTVRVDACAHVEWSTHLLADARIEQHRQLVEAGDDALYGDTDSCYATRRVDRRAGPELGQWGHEGSMRDWGALAPKVYRYRCCDDCAACHSKKRAPGRWHVRGKGMPGLDAAGWEGLRAGRAWRADVGARPIRTSLRVGGGLFVRGSLARSLHPTPGWIGDRHHDESTGSTRPPTVTSYLSAHPGEEMIS